MSTSLDSTQTIAIRLAGRHDQEAVARLAAVDSVAVPSGPVLLAVVDGKPLAAIPFDGGRPIADPFSPTADLIELLRARAAHLGAVTVTPRRRFLRRLAAREA